ncbi:MAG: Rieske 2Fe-2S domain-containing protein [Fimbriimonas sp.]|nr:Rieske 2Fe-2S domain-containing protein [Fimbriimonas sp.]
MERRLQEEFPVSWVDDDYVTRREFFRFMTLASGGLAVGTAGIAAWSALSRESRSFDPVRIASRAEMRAGSSLAFAYPRSTDLCLLIRRPTGEFVAYSRRCTHLSCPVDYQPDHDRIYCPCHNGAFSLEDGHVLQGPPPRPLPQIRLEFRGDDIFAVGLMRGEA